MSLCRVTIEDMRLSRCVTLSDSFFLNQWRMHRDGSREGKCSRRLAFTLPNLPEDGAQKIEAQLEKWGFNTIEKQTVSLDEARARELAMSWGAERSYEFDPDEDEGSFLMPYNLRPHPAEWDEPPLEKKPEGEEGEEEPPPPEEGEGETEEVPPEPVCTKTMPYDVRKMVGILTSGECTVYLLSRYGAVHALQTLTGPQEPAVARFHETTAGTLRAHYGASRHNFVVHASASAILTRKEIKLFLNAMRGSSPSLSSSPMLFVQQL